MAQELEFSSPSFTGKLPECPASLIARALPAYLRHIRQKKSVARLQFASQWFINKL
jgi:hypothetical protein